MPIATSKPPAANTSGNSFSQSKDKPEEKPDKQPKQQEPEKAKPVKIAAADFKTSAEKNSEKEKQSQEPKGAVGRDKLKDLMPGMDTSKKGINDVPPEAKKEAVTMIDKIANDIIKAKESGEKAPNTNLCVVTVPGTNLYFPLEGQSKLLSIYLGHL